MTPEDYVSYPLALALKKAGFDCEQSHYYCKGEATIAVDILCTSDCNCARMKRYDKMNKHK